MNGFRRLFNLDDANDNLRIIITRHGERVDFTLGKNWLHDYKNGRRDPRIPHLTQRPNFEDWKYDSPLTINGESQSAHIGTKLRDLGLLIDYCYSSPAYRSIQTANKILESQGRSNVPIHVEPGLFECPAWYTKQPLVFIPPKYLAKDRKLNVSRNYTPFYSGVDPTEDETDYYRRSRHLIRNIIDYHKHTGGTVLLSGHGGSIEAVTRGLRSLRHRYVGPEQLRQEAVRVSYANFAILERDAHTRKWTVRLPEAGAIPGLLSRQTRIPLYGISTEHFTIPAVAEKPATARRRRTRKLQYRH